MKIFALITILLLSGCSSPSAVDKVAEGRVVPCSSLSIEEKYVGGTPLDCLDGSGPLQLEQLRGPLVLNIWGSWCAPCKEEIPYFVDFYAKAEGKVALAGVAVEEPNTRDAQDFIRKHGMTWPNFIDRDGHTRASFGMGVPVTLFINKSGRIVHRHVGVLTSEAQLLKLTRKYLRINLR
jgi:cytochrome c biogenesis protein CcmG/thiol:disulfide interchange protein DsbE